LDAVHSSIGKGLVDSMAAVHDFSFKRKKALTKNSIFSGILNRQINEEARLLAT
jgi:hypothetical protein